MDPLSVRRERERKKERERETASCILCVIRVTYFRDWQIRGKGSREKIKRSRGTKDRNERKKPEG